MEHICLIFLYSLPIKEFYWILSEGGVEAGGGIEPPHVGFANRSITTLLPSHTQTRDELHNP